MEVRPNEIKFPIEKLDERIEILLNDMSDELSGMTYSEIKNAIEIEESDNYDLETCHKK